MGLAFALIWSSAFSSARIIVAAAPPIASLALRFAISGVVGVILARMFHQNWNLSRAQWRSVIIFGICQNALYLGLNFVAMQWIEASLAAIIASSMPLIVAAANWVIFREKLPVMGVIGLMAGFGGVALIMAQRLGGGVDPLGVTLCLIGAAALAVATLTVRGASSAGSGGVLMIVGLQMLVGSVVLLPFALMFETWEVQWSWQLLAAFTYTVFAPGLLATWIWFLLVQRIGATRGATFHFLNPFFGVAIAAAILGERLGWIDILGVTIIAAGILAVQLARASR
jgi:drug/metabolite transporter (DMT)-like permease